MIARETAMRSPFEMKGDGSERWIRGRFPMLEVSFRPLEGGGRRSLVVRRPHVKRGAGRTARAWLRAQPSFATAAFTPSTCFEALSSPSKIAAISLFLSMTNVIRAVLPRMLRRKLVAP